MVEETETTMTLVVVRMILQTARRRMTRMGESSLQLKLQSKPSYKGARQRKD